MNHSLKRAAMMMMVLVFGFTGLCLADEAQKIDACAFLTKADIQAALGQEVSEGKINTKANPVVGQPCEYKVGGYGVFSLLVKKANAGQNADSVMAELKKRNVEVSNAGAVGDRSFFSSPGYGMIQLNTFKGDTYLIITMLVPGMADAAQKSAAEKLMRTAVSKI